MLPSVERYLQQLPHGADSYSLCRIKGSVVFGILSSCGLPLPLGPDLVPPSSRALTEELPTVNDWVPEVLYVSLALAIRELRFPGPDGDRQHDEWMLEENRKLLRGPLYRILFMVASPERIIPAGGERWGRFHRGSTLAVKSERKGLVKGRLTYPPKLFPGLLLRGFGGALQAAAEAAGAEGVSITHVVKSDTSVEYELLWG